MRFEYRRAERELWPSAQGAAKIGRNNTPNGQGRGTPQRAPIRPLLSNLYMRRFVLGWKKLGHEKRLQEYIIDYGFRRMTG